MTEIIGKAGSKQPVGYLAPEIPALSATFVYEEIHALERRGIEVIPFAVHRRGNIATGQKSLISRTRVLYSKHEIIDVLSSPLHVARHLRGLCCALRWLGKDIADSRSLRSAAKLVFQFLAGARLATELKKQRCAHLHIHFAHVPTQIGMYASAFAELPFTVTAHANDIFERGFLLKNKADRALKIFCISDFNRRFLISIGLPEEKLTVVRCGVSFSSVTRSQHPAGKKVCIGSLGRLVEKKGIDILIQAMAQLRNMPQLIILSIAGDGPLREELEVLTAKLGLSDRVTFEGALTHSQVVEWMKSLDMFVLACKMDSQGDMDGIPVVLMEAMSQSVPVVSTRLSGIPELVIHEKTGLLADPGDSLDLAEQIRRLLEEPAMKECIVNQALQHVVEEFGQDVNVSRLLRHMELN